MSRTCSLIVLLALAGCSDPAHVDPVTPTEEVVVAPWVCGAVLLPSGASDQLQDLVVTLGPTSAGWVQASGEFELDASRVGREELLVVTVLGAASDHGAAGAPMLSAVADPREPRLVVSTRTTAIVRTLMPLLEGDPARDLARARVLASVPEVLALGVFLDSALSQNPRMFACGARDPGYRHKLLDAVAASRIALEARGL